MKKQGQIHIQQMRLAEAASLIQYSGLSPTSDNLCIHTEGIIGFHSHIDLRGRILSTGNNDRKIRTERSWAWICKKFALMNERKEVNSAIFPRAFHCTGMSIIWVSLYTLDTLSLQPSLRDLRECEWEKEKDKGWERFYMTVGTIFLPFIHMIISCLMEEGLRSLHW